MTCTYAGARVNVEGRGFLGFATMTALDTDTTIGSTTTYQQNYPYTGMVSVAEQRLGTTLVGKVTSTTSAGHTGPGAG